MLLIYWMPDLYRWLLLKTIDIKANMGFTYMNLWLDQEMFCSIVVDSCISVLHSHLKLKWLKSYLIRYENLLFKLITHVIETMMLDNKMYISREKPHLSDVLDPEYPDSGFCNSPSKTLLVHIRILCSLKST